MNTSNRKAFLDMIAFSEGTSAIPNSNDGYGVLVGGGIFYDYTSHPHQLIHVNKTLNSTAAGRYQLLARYYDFYRKLLGLKDFSPASQNAIAIQQISECKALTDVDAGRFDVAVGKCKRIWASLPNAGYGQRENTLASLQSAYVKAGGVLA